MDARAERIAVVADSLLAGNLSELGTAGYGVMQLPPATLDDSTAREWVEQTAEQITEYLRHGYTVCLLGDGVWDDLLAAELARYGRDRLAACRNDLRMSYTK